MANQWTASPSRWAEQVEEEEAQNGGSLLGDEFPTLGQSLKQGKPQKKKLQKMSLAEFTAAASRGSSISDSQIRASLPTAPRGREAGEDRQASGLGGAFKEYDGQRRGYSRFGDEEGGRRGRDEEMMPSRADVVDDWGKERKFTPSEGGSRGFGGGGFGGGFRQRDGPQDRDRQGGYGERRGYAEDGPSRADMEDSWGRRSQPVDDGRGQGFEGRDRRGGGFEDRDRRGGSFRDRSRYDEPSRADEGDWGTRRQLSPASDGGASRSKGYGFSGDRSSEPDKWARTSSEAPTSQPSERPKLNLKPRSIPLGESAPVPAPSSAPRKNDPFGAARPREEVLKEKGLDPVKEELKLEHHAELREETEEEKVLKAEIEDVRLKLEVLRAADGESEETKEMQQQLDDKEVNLLKLAAELDDRVKFPKKHLPVDGDKPVEQAEAEFKATDSRPARGGMAPRENGGRW